MDNYSEFDSLLGDEPAEDNDEFIDGDNYVLCQSCGDAHHRAHSVGCQDCDAYVGENCYYLNYDNYEVVSDGAVSWFGDKCPFCNPINDEFEELDESADYSEFDDLLGDEPAMDDDEFSGGYQYVCVICNHPGTIIDGDETTGGFYANCNHAVCFDCVYDTISNGADPSVCPICGIQNESAGDYSEFDDLLGDEPAEDNDEFSDPVTELIDWLNDNATPEIINGRIRLYQFDNGQRIDVTEQVLNMDHVVDIKLFNSDKKKIVIVKTDVINDNAMTIAMFDIDQMCWEIATIPTSSL